MADHDHLISAPSNDAVTLGKALGIFHFGGHSLDAEVTGSVYFRPTPHLVLEGSFQTSDHPLELVGQFLEDREAKIQLEGSSVRRALIVTTLKAGEPSTFRARLRQGPLTAGTEGPCSTVQFHLVNFPDFMVQRDGQVRRNHMSLRDDQFEIEVDPVPNFDEVLTTLKEEGGYAITHWGVLRRRDGERMDFSSAEAELSKLHSFLSFARGAWAGLLAPRGVGSDGQVVWSEWADRSVSEWKSHASWWDRQNAQALEAGYDGFSHRWDKPYWQEVLSTAIYWYLRSNSAGSGAGVDGGLILTQAALEQVAWARLVEEWRSVSAQGFRRLFASDQLRLLLSRMDVPLSIPDRMTGLVQFGRADAWDGPRVLTEIRNSLVHPSKHEPASRQRAPYFEAWNLGQWYLELSLLNLVGFNDAYSDRTRTGGWVGEVQELPWQSR